MTPNNKRVASNNLSGSEPSAMVRQSLDLRLLENTFENVFGLEVDTEPVNGDSEFKHDVRLGAAWRPSDPSAFDILYGRPRLGLISRQFRRMRHSSRSISTGVGLSAYRPTSGVIVFPRDQTQVTVARSLDSVCKMARRRDLARESLRVEIAAASLVPEHTARVLSSDLESSGTPYINQKFIENNFPAEAREWPTLFRSCLEIVEICADRQRPQHIVVGELIRQLVPHFGQQADSEFSSASLDTVQRVVRALEPFKDMIVSTSFAHGDMTRPNVHRQVADEIKLIDWGNGGERPLVFDIVVHEFYLERPEFWSRVLGATNVSEFDQAGLGSFESHVRTMFDMAGIEYTVPQLQAHILTSFLWLATCNRTRYLGVDEIEGGAFFQHLDFVTEMLTSS